MSFLIRDTLTNVLHRGMENLQSGKLKMTATNWPTGFYEDGIYDPQDKAKGLFRNHVVVRVSPAEFNIIGLILR
jgi:hypothetical protein